MRKLALMAGSIVALCAACTGGKVYDSYNHTPIAGWEKTDTLAFNVSRLAEGGLYATDLGLRINNAFPFLSLTLIVEQTVFPSMQHRADTLNCRLMDAKGNARGQGVSYYQYHFRVSERALQPGDSLHITVRHDMKREIMPGISDVGIALTRK